ncbi:MAG: shikimate dehydrogenase [Candidatus Latescibacterota bacterium]|nr:shikimate dehydrogenase [Candidatus Latescibacterota bacterium]
MISGSTGILGVIGDPVQHSASPAMHNAALTATGLNFVYVAFHVLPKRVPEVTEAMRALQIRGLNVTVPYKQAVMEHLDEISPEAATIGAVNTIERTPEGRLIGHNTDAYGITASLREDGGLQHLPEQVVLLGAGGAARAILYALLQAEEVKDVVLVNRTVARAEALAGELDTSGRTRVCSPQDLAIDGARLLINSTSVGMSPDAEVSPLADDSVLHNDLVVVDIVYRPLHTRLLQQAQKAGARTVDGLGMLAHQGARSFEIWTGTKAPVAIMRETLENIASSN